MEDGEFTETAESCEVCGTRRAVLRAGYLYCAECGMRSADSQPLIQFSEDIFAGAKIIKRKIRTKVEKDELSNMWSTWHAHNMILLGLVEETCFCGASPALGTTVLRLWARWLRYNKVAFFSRRQAAPHITLGFNPRDLKLLYNMKKPRKRIIKSGEDGDDNFQSQKARATRSRTDLVKHHHQQFLDSQSSAVPLASQTLENIKIEEESLPKTIQFNSYTKRHLRKTLTEEKLKEHVEHGYCGSACKCFKKVKPTPNNRKRISYIFNLYVLLFLGLQVVNDDIQLGDVIRWCREGHLTFGSYGHFFPEDMHFKKTDRFRISPTLFTHRSILKTTHRFAKILQVNGIRCPDIESLIKRYIEELELPHELYRIIYKIVVFSKNFDNYYPLNAKEYPNYEGIALSYIIVTLKLIFGLDGVTENKISSSANDINKILDLGKDVKNLDVFPDEEKPMFRRLFVWKDWAKYIEYRKVCLRQCHYPTRMRSDPNDSDKPNLFLHHRNKTRKMQLDGEVKNNTSSIIKSLLQGIEDKNCEDVKILYPNFTFSLTPNYSYVKELLTWQYLDTAYSDIIVNKEILNESFSQYNLSYLINPNPLQKLLNFKGYRLYIHNFTANPDLTVDTLKFRRRRRTTDSKRMLSKLVKIIDCDLPTWESEIQKEKISSFIQTTEFIGDKLENHTVTLDDTRHYSTKVKSNIYTNRPIGKLKGSIDLHVCFQHYWLRHYPFIHRKFTQSAFNEELDSNFPPSFVWILKECATMAEMSALALYKEVCSIEKKIMENLDSRDRLNERRKRAAVSRLKNESRERVNICLTRKIKNSFKTCDNAA